MRILKLAMASFVLSTLVSISASAATMVEYALIVALVAKDFEKGNSTVDVGTYEDKAHGPVKIQCTPKGLREAPQCTAKPRRGEKLPTKVLAFALGSEKPHLVLQIGEESKVTVHLQGTESPKKLQ